jgi:hypothetical protein
MDGITLIVVHDNEGWAVLLLLGPLFPRWSTITTAVEIAQNMEEDVRSGRTTWKQAGQPER